MVAWHDGAPDPRVGWQEIDSQRVSSRFMPRWAARLLLSVVEIGAQLAEEVSEQDARAEGTAGLAALRALWDSNPRWPRWDSNPPVRVIRYEAIGQVSERAEERR
jgi:hypothetical protein